MKKITLITLLLIAMLSACKKDDNTDARDKYVGTWTGTNTVNIPLLNLNEQSEGNQTISKSSTNNQRLLVTSGTEMMNANMSGESYVYETYTYTENSNGVTWVKVINGSGNLVGNTLTETGTVSISIMGETYTGTWVSSMTKQ